MALRKLGGWTLFLAALLAAVWGIDAKVRVVVVGDDGVPVVGATAGLSLDSPWPWGVRTVEVSALTDSEGMATLSGNSAARSVAAWAHKTGYYNTVSSRVVFTGKEWSPWTPWSLRHWTPWNQTVMLLMKKIGNPIAMYAKRVGASESLMIPQMGKDYSYDLERGDWVAPHGKGATQDFIFRLDGEYQSSGDQPFDVMLTLTFPNAGDGVISVLAPPHTGSRLRLPRHAATTGYERQLIKRTYRKGPDSLIETGTRDDQNFLFRVRTLTDKDGKIRHANYGKISGDIQFWSYRAMRFTYYLNPAPNNLNLEFDWSRNLIPGLASFESPSGP